MKVEELTSEAELKQRSQAPVFVLGCVRSGTKLLYHMLLSSGNFAVYHTESNVFNLLAFKYGSLGNRQNRQKLLDSWLRSKLFERSGLLTEEIAPQILRDCRNEGDFLRILMETIARKQGAKRWAETTPQHLLYLPIIKKLIPDALIIHIIRDGRDVAVSLDKIRWIRPFSWDRRNSLLAAALFWKWTVRRGRKYGRKLGPDYLEIRYEALVESPEETLAVVGEFIGENLDYGTIRRTSLGAVDSPNSSFKSDQALKDLNPIDRWKTLLSESQIAEVETAIGDMLVELKYPLSAKPSRANVMQRLRAIIYPASFDIKNWLKSHTPLGRRAGTKRMEIKESVPGS